MHLLIPEQTLLTSLFCLRELHYADQDFLSTHSLVKNSYNATWGLSPRNARLHTNETTGIWAKICTPYPPCEHQGPVESHSSEYKQMASKPTRTAKGWPLRPVKKYKDICHSYKLTSGPVVPRRATTAQRNSRTVTQTILNGCCVGASHQTLPPFLSLFSCSLIFSSQVDHQSSSHCILPQIKAVHFTKIIKRREASAMLH